MIYMGNVLPGCETHRWNVLSVQEQSEMKNGDRQQKSYSIYSKFPCTLFGLQGYCAKLVEFKTSRNNQCERNVTDTMTDECWQRQYGRSVYRHCKDEFIHSELHNTLFFTALRIHTDFQIISLPDVSWSVSCNYR